MESNDLMERSASPASVTRLWLRRKCRDNARCSRDILSELWRRGRFHAYVPPFMHSAESSGVSHIFRWRRSMPRLARGEN